MKNLLRDQYTIIVYYIIYYVMFKMRPIIYTEKMSWAKNILRPTNFKKWPNIFIKFIKRLKYDCITWFITWCSRCDPLCCLKNYNNNSTLFNIYSLYTLEVLIKWLLDSWWILSNTWIWKKEKRFIYCIKRSWLIFKMCLNVSFFPFL